MAITEIYLSDPITSIVTKSNTISNSVGDITQLFSGDSTIVDGFNTLRDLISPFDDSAEIIAIGRDGFGVSVYGQGFGNLTYDSASGVFTYTAPTTAQFRSLFSGDSAISYNDSTGQFSLIPNAFSADKLLDSSLTSSKFLNLVTLNIKNSSGTVLKTLYSPGD